MVFKELDAVSGGGGGGGGGTGLLETLSTVDLHLKAEKSAAQGQAPAAEKTEAVRVL